MSPPGGSPWSLYAKANSPHDHRRFNPVFRRRDMALLVGWRVQVKEGLIGTAITLTVMLVIVVLFNFM